MKIILKEKYKSLQPFESDELNSFTVIIGKNGSGKSQLLNLFNPAIQDKNKLSEIIVISPNLQTIQFEGILKVNLNSFSPEQLRTIVDIRYQSYLSYINSNDSKLIGFIIKNNLQDKAKAVTKELIESTQENTELLSDSEEYHSLIKEFYSKIEVVGYTAMYRSGIITKNIEKHVLSRIDFNKRTEKNVSSIITLAEKLGKDIYKLKREDFFNALLDDSFIDDNDLFNSKIESIFYNYARRRQTNRLNWFFKKEEGVVNDSISDLDFMKKFIPPWKIINEILEKHNLDFCFEGIEKEDFREDITINFRLLKKSSNEPIPFTDLSSGEKIILGLILKLFTTEYYGQNLSFTDLILLDEPDAHLHPEMSNLLINILKNVFVNKLGIKVIMTTHSPSTIALVEEDDIFQISNFNNTFLKKIAKDDALKLLTSFIPTLSIDYKNHKQVFVESPTDQYYYQTIFNILFQQANYPFRLYFISNDYGKGSSSQVIKAVNAIRSSENHSFYGIIDWDKTNTDSDFIKVHGEGSRYSLENYVYDPIYIVILLMTMEAHNIHRELGIENTYNQYNLGSDKDLCEKAIQWFFEKYLNKYSLSKESMNETRAVKYYNGFEFELPIWYLEFQGHDLEIRLKGVFTALGNSKNEGYLQKELTKIIARCFPFIHMDSVDVINKIISPYL
ncbi:ATP-dependent nuclease [Chryseobacterium sp. HMWF035]|uniref:ATP-dependent nuclease n=2 Tax=unclassified Chryseobacterium TaxID=2593645 RepID=UPI0014021663|nr:ATP-binding protein [Chryseobacterium sp. HMWF035]